jgi:hypothetical protein
VFLGPLRVQQHVTLNLLFRQAACLRGLRDMLFNKWSGDGLFGAKFLSPYGNLVQGWLNGTWLAEFNMVVWAVLPFSRFQPCIGWLVGFSDSALWRNQVLRLPSSIFGF